MKWMYEWNCSHFVFAIDFQFQLSLFDEYDT